MQVFVCNLKGHFITMDVHQNDTIATVKKKIEDREGVPADYQRLIFSGHYLNNVSRLCDYDICTGNTLYLMLPMLSCNQCTCHTHQDLCVNQD
jgi:ubiquitin-large subunit ribosomal protein L40e